LYAHAEEADLYRLLLFVSGATPRSMRAVATVRKLCEESLVGRYELKVVDVFRDPLLARDYQIVALPTLLKLAPNPRRLFVGEMSDIAPLIAGLGLAA
jgi:circadian clock protein KaiB